MNLEVINRFIDEYIQYNFIFSDVFLKNIRNGCESWKKDWVEVFKRLLRQIRRGEYSPVLDKKGRFRVINPLVKNQYMIIFFLKQNNGSYFIDNIKIGFINI